MYKFVSCCLLISCLFSCNTNKIAGLWEVEKVEIGQDEMTPMARWVRFNSDLSQESGNGWQQHSIGSYSYDQKAQRLAIINTNGVKDNSDPFEVNLGGDKMTWSRIEEGQQVKVFLQKISRLPTSPADQLMGVWDLLEVKEDGKEVTNRFDPDEKRYMFLRWDKLFNIQHTPDGRLNGVYRVNAHKPEIEFIFYGSDKREYWSYEFSKDQLQLKSVNTPSSIEMRYQRIDTFIQ